MHNIFEKVPIPLHNAIFIINHRAGDSFSELDKVREYRVIRKFFNRWSGHVDVMHSSGGEEEGAGQMEESHIVQYLNS